MLIAVLGFLSTVALPAFAWSATAPSNICTTSTGCVAASHTFTGDCTSSSVCIFATGSTVYDSVDYYDPGTSTGAYNDCIATGSATTGSPDDACGITGTYTFALYLVTSKTFSDYSCGSSAPSGTSELSSSNKFTATSGLYPVPPVVVTSAGYSLTTGGDYIWYTTYTGNYNDNGHTYGCEYMTTVSISTTASSTGSVSPGTSVTDTATVTLASGGTPKGTVQFYWCGPTSSLASCSSSGNALGSAVSLYKGSATSNSISPTAPGWYCFAAYFTPSAGSGSASSTTTTNECFDVVPVPTSISTWASSTGTVAPGTPISDKATVSATSGTPTGTVQFYWCGPTSSPTACSSSGTALGSPVTLTSGSATSGSISPTAAGFYCFAAYYTPTGGFGSSYSTTTTKECFQVVGGTSVSSMASSTGIVAPGTTVTDMATITSSSGSPTGTAQFYTCGPFASLPTQAACTGSESALGSPITLTAATSTTSTAPSPDFAPTVAGYYCFEAVYTATGSFTSSSATDVTNECFQVVAGTTLTTTASSTGSVAPGTSVTDTASVTSTSGTPDGTVQFYFCGPTAADISCATSPGNAVGSPVTLSGGLATSTSESPTVAGYYCWSAVYTPGPSSSFTGSESTTTTNECFTVTTTGLTTTASSTGTVSPGTPVSDTATVTLSSGGPAAGTVQFYWCGPTTSPASCSSSGTALGGPVTLVSGVATSGSITPTAPGYYCFAAYYTPIGGVGSSSSTTTTKECFNVQTTSTVPQFPMGMGVLLAMAAPALLLLRKRAGFSAAR